MGMTEIGGLLEQWRLDEDEAEARRRWDEPWNGMPTPFPDAHSEPALAFRMFRVAIAMVTSSVVRDCTGLPLMKESNRSETASGSSVWARSLRIGFQNLKEATRSGVFRPGFGARRLSAPGRRGSNRKSVLRRLFGEVCCGR